MCEYSFGAVDPNTTQAFSGTTSKVPKVNLWVPRSKDVTLVQVGPPKKNNIKKTRGTPKTKNAKHIYIYTHIDDLKNTQNAKEPQRSQTKQHIKIIKQQKQIVQHLNKELVLN